MQTSNGNHKPGGSAGRHKLAKELCKEYAIDLYFAHYILGRSQESAFQMKGTHPELPYGECQKLAVKMILDSMFETEK